MSNDRFENHKHGDGSLHVLVKINPKKAVEEADVSALVSTTSNDTFCKLKEDKFLLDKKIFKRLMPFSRKYNVFLKNIFNKLIKRQDKSIQLKNCELAAVNREGENICIFGNKINYNSPKKIPSRLLMVFIGKSELNKLWIRTIIILKNLKKNQKNLKRLT